jgi:hypothetical protein
VGPIIARINFPVKKNAAFLLKNGEISKKLRNF